MRDATVDSVLSITSSRGFSLWFKVLINTESLSDMDISLIDITVWILYTGSYRPVLQ